MRFKRRYARILLVALLSTLVLLLQSRLAGRSSSIQIAAVFGAMFLILFVVQFLERRFIPTPLSVLRRILNSCAREGYRVTTVRDFLTETSEEDLLRDDEVHVLTNALESYDMTPPATEVIAKNIRDGVKYIYYLPGIEEYPTLGDEKDAFVNGIHAYDPTLSAQDIDANVLFYVINEECLYNFAIVRRRSRGTMSAYWYVTTPGPDVKTQSPWPGSEEQRVTQSTDVEKQVDRRLVILAVDRNLCDELFRVFQELGRGRQVAALSAGLRSNRSWRFA